MEDRYCAEIRARLTIPNDRRSREETGRRKRGIGYQKSMDTQAESATSKTYDAGVALAKSLPKSTISSDTPHPEKVEAVREVAPKDVQRIANRINVKPGMRNLLRAMLQKSLQVVIYEKGSGLPSIKQLNKESFKQTFMQALRNIGRRQTGGFNKSIHELTVEDAYNIMNTPGYAHGGISLSSEDTYYKTKFDYLRIL